MITNEEQMKLLNAKKEELGIGGLFELAEDEQDEFMSTLSENEKLDLTRKIIDYMDFCLAGMTNNV